MDIREYFVKCVFSPLRKFENTRMKAVKYKNKNKLLFLYYYIKYSRYQIKYNTQIPVSVKIGEKFAIGHYGGIVINRNVIIGNNARIMNGILIGEEVRGERKGTPIIKDNVFIGTNAVVVGKIIIGNNVLIAPNSFVNFDVPDDSIVIGNPARIIYKKDASKEYC